MSAKKLRIGSNPLNWIKPTTDENYKSNTGAVEQIQPTTVPATDVVAAEMLLPEAPNPPKVKEETPRTVDFTEPKSIGRPYYFIPISAKSKEALYQKYKDLSNWLKGEGGNCIFGDMAYTMLIGRNHFFIRSAIIVSGASELENKLKDILEAGKASLFFSRSPEEKIPKPDPALKEQGNQFLKELGDGKIKDPESCLKRLVSIAELYIKGYDLNWGDLYSGSNYRRIPMPTYPFALNRYWSNSLIGTGADNEKLHPLVDFNSSTLDEQCFTKVFTGNEFFLKDHLVGKDKILPGVAYLEMARAAGSLASTDAEVSGLRDIVWKSPIRLNDKNTSHLTKISLFPYADNVEFEVSSKGVNNQKVIHGIGKIDLKKRDGQSKDAAVTDIDRIRERCTKKMSGRECYRVFAERGLNLGRSFQTIKEMYCGEKEVISYIELPEHLNSDFSLYGLHPALMDGALESVIGLMSDKEMESKVLALPFEMGSVEIYGEIPKKFYSHAKELDNSNTEEGVRRCNVNILDESGRIVIMMKGFAIRPFFQFEKPVVAGLKEKLYYNVVWDEGSAYENPVESEDGAKANLLVFAGNDINAGFLRECYERASNDKCEIVLVTPGKSYKAVDAGTYEIDLAKPNDYKRLLEDLSARGLFPTDIIHTLAYLKGDTDEQLKSGYYAAFNLSQALSEHKAQDKLHFVYTYPVNGRTVLPVHAAMGGFSRTARIENTKWIYKTLGIQSENSMNDVLNVAFKELSSKYDKEVEVIIENGKRMVKRLKQCILKDGPSKEAILEEDGVYLITGGTGGLGLIFARYISETVKGAKLVLTGRSQPDDKKLNLLKELKNNSAEVLYIKSDVSDRDAAEKLAAEIKQRFGRLDGIIHSAGVIKDAYIYKKTHKEIKEVLAPKIYGTLNLDEVFKGENLKFFVLFSSIAALTGNAGQCDYSYANSFMDYFSVYRQSMVAEGKRKGKTLSINWSIWQDGGMRVNESTQTLFADTMGIKPLSTETGLEAFEKGLISDIAQFLIVEGEKEKLDYILGQTAKQKKLDIPAGVNNGELLKKIQSGLVGVVGELLKIQENDIHLDRELSEFGFNSLSLTDFSNEVNKLYDVSITPAIFFEHPTLRSFAQYLFNEFNGNFIEYYYSGKSNKAEEKAEVCEETLAEQPTVGEIARKPRFWDDGLASSGGNPRANEPIAIIGMSGVMPLSEDLDEFWKKIEAGCDLISEVPKERWDWEEVDRKANMQVSRWGGFMKEVDKFDALFFGISPREADLMDPQQRILLETVWKTIEDAGYKPSDLSGSKTGFFIGATTMDYVDVERDNNIQIEAYSTTGASHCILANRVSFILNLQGPSVPIDTACSSSLIAIHQAIRSIRDGDSDMAIAGGVNVLLSSPVFVSFTKSGMLSPDGRCKTFDKSANGYVRGEGCGTILMKPLSKAIEDRDHIYAVLKGSAVNHGGRANSLTAPNPNAQAKLIVTAYERAGIAPDTISYIEAHGTGTNLGDPVEINGLKIAFKEMYKKNNMKQSSENYCGLCSVKTNIGHLEAAAGIAGILKVLLSLKYKKIPGNVHLKEVNPYIDLKGSPFYIVDEAREWKYLKDGNGQDIPRRAGVSSFGFGGANSHIVLEEYIRPGHKRDLADNKPVLLVLSAKNDGCLYESARRLKEFLQSDDATKKELRLIDIAYTLQVGREAMEERLAIVGITREEIISRLTDYLNHKDKVKSLFCGNTAQTGKMPMLDMDGDDQEYLNTLIRKNKLEKLAKLWVEGTSIDWGLLYQSEKPFRVSIPSYPFAKVRHWVSNQNYDNRQSIQYGVHNALHPMIDSNESTIEEEKFKKYLSNREFYIRDHVVAGQNLMPGVAYLEIARAAGELAGQRPVRCLRDVVWFKPLDVGKDGKDVYIGLNPSSSAVEYELYSLESGQKNIYSQGSFLFDSEFRAPRKFNIDEIISRCTGRKNKEECYQGVFKKVGFDYGPTFQVTQEAFLGNGEGIARLELPQSVPGGFDDFVLHPSLIDGALRAVTWIGGGEASKSQSLRVPFALGELVIFGTLTQVCYAYATLSEEPGENDITKYSIAILDEQGQELICINNFAVREYKNAKALQQTNEGRKLSYYTPVWHRLSLDSEHGVQQTENGGHLVVFEPDDVSSGKGKYSKNLGYAYEKIVTVVKGREFSKLRDSCYSIDPGSREDYRRLIKELVLAGIKPARIAHLWNADSQNADRYDRSDGAKLHTDLKADMSDGLYSILYLFQELSAAKLDMEIKCLFAFSGSEDTNPQFAAVYGLARTIASVSSRFELTTMEICDDLDSGVMDAVNAELCFNDSINGKQIRIADGKRYVRKMRLDDNTKNITPPLKKNGVYLITGGSGALGMILAEYLARKYSSRLILTGRRPQDGEIDEKLSRLRDYGAEAVYHQGDVGIYEDAENAVKAAKDSFGKLDGILHCAGIGDSTSIFKANTESYEKTLIPKLYGTVNLDLATAGDELDLFVLFSSVTAETGDLGGGSYASANCFMDRYSVMREKLRVQNKRKGRTVSINWPFWTDGGFELPTELLKYYTESSGMREINSGIGLKAFDDIMGMGASQILVAYGNPLQIAGLFETVDAQKLEAAPDTGRNEHEIVHPGDRSALHAGAQKYLKEMFAKATQVPINQIGSQTEFDKFGIDSILIMEMNKQLEKDFGALPRTLFFEYNKIDDIADYFVKNHSDKLKVVIGIGDKENNSIRSETSGHLHTAYSEAAMPETSPVVKSRFMYSDKESAGNTSRHDIYEDDIAIIGISGRYPGSDNLDEFWENLKAGKDCITEIPPDRWDCTEEFDPERGKKGKYYCKMGGFVNDVDKFDAQFFNMSQRDAEGSDPQERLFLETVHHTIEDAGYRRSDFSRVKVGVYVGVMYGQYNLFGVEETLKGNPMALNSLHASIANRVSYYFNLTGPSIALDSMCSSSLTALHLACESMCRGETDMAIAGGVNLAIHPDKYRFLCSVGFISGDGRCRSYGEGGDGYVPGEGVGAVLLKPLGKARKDNDHIYAVIKATAINHNGRTNGYSVPSPGAQVQLMSETFAKSGVDPRTISYIEGHGTGTSLGDAIELVGLSKAFGDIADERQFCPIGSVKSNVGHLESAAGVVALTKVILQMKNRQIVPSIHSDVLNSNINFKDSPFYVQHELSEWKRPVTIEDRVKREHPRRATISSFGAGGSNAHIILEEFNGPKGEKSSRRGSKNVFVLSAKSREGLYSYAKNFVDFLDKKLSQDEGNFKLLLERTGKDLVEIISGILKVDSSEINISDKFEEYGFDWVSLSALTDRVNQKYKLLLSPTLLGVKTIEDYVGYMVDKHADTLERYYNSEPDADDSDSTGQEDIDYQSVMYTMQVGREALEERLAVVAASLEELKEKLKKYCGNEKDINNLYTGNVKQKKNDGGMLAGVEDVESYTEKILLCGDMEQLAKLWVSGIDLDWKLLYASSSPRRIPLPLYPFKREKYWAPDHKTNTGVLEAPKLKMTGLHPLIDTNESTFNEQIFKKTLASNDTFFNGIAISNGKMLSMPAFIEMARAAGKMSDREKTVVAVRDVKWSKPDAAIKEGSELYINLYPQNDYAEYEVYLKCDSGAHGAILNQGYLEYSSGVEAPLRGRGLDIEGIKASCNNLFSTDDSYDILKKCGLDYGKAFRPIKELRSGGNEMLALLELGEGMMVQDGMLLHPVLMEGMLQAALLLLYGTGGSEGLYMPYSLKELKILRQLPVACYTYVQKIEGIKGACFDIKLIDTNNNLLADIKEFKVKGLRSLTSYSQY